MNRFRFFATPILSIVLLLTAGAAAGQSSPNSPHALDTATNIDTPAQSTPRLEERYPRYQIQREDVLAVTFPLSQELNQTVTVQPDGFIDLQSARSLHIQGMTVPQAVDAIKAAYTGILRDPIVTIDLQDFQKPFFTVNGQVGKPGQYELRSEITVTEAIAIAGGLASTSRMQAFLFHRVDAQWFHVEKLNLKDVFNGKKAKEDAVLQPGDMIYVPENTITRFRKYVPYGINAGSYLAASQSY